MATRVRKVMERPSAVRNKLRHLEEENRALKRALAQKHGHEGTRVSYQADVLEDRFLPDHAAVTFRLGPHVNQSGEAFQALLLGDRLEITSTAGPLRVRRVTPSRIQLFSSPRRED